MAKEAKVEIGEKAVITDSLKVSAKADIKADAKSDVKKVDIATAKSETVKLEGKFAKVEINSEAKVEVAANTKIENIVANSNATINLDKTAVVDKVDKGSNTVVVGGEGQVGPSVPPASGGSSGGGGWYPPIDTTVRVSGISVEGKDKATTITTKNGTLQMVATVTPGNASNKSVTWSVTNGTGSATIDQNGLLKAVTNGTVTVKATAKDGSGVTGQLVVTISGQEEPVAETVSTEEELIRKLADESASIIKLGADITLDSYLNVTRDVTIDGNSYSLTRSVGDTATDNESYVVMVSSGKLTAKNIKFVSNNTQTNPVANAVGITVQADASLDLDGATITSTSTNRSAYGVYLQDGAAAASIKNTVFNLTANAKDRNRIAIGFETTDLNNANPFSILTKSGNTIPDGAYEISFYVPAGFVGDPVALMEAALAKGQKGLYWGDKKVEPEVSKENFADGEVQIAYPEGPEGIYKSGASYKDGKFSFTGSYTVHSDSTTGSTSVLVTFKAPEGAISAKFIASDGTTVLKDYTSIENGACEAWITLGIGDNAETYTAPKFEFYKDGKLIAIRTFTSEGLAITKPITPPTINTATLDELKDALANTNIKTINITADIPDIPERLVVDRGVTINGSNHKLTYTAAINGLEYGKRHGILIIADGVMINDLTVEMTEAANWQGVYGIQVYNAKGVVLNNYTGTKADGALLVNASEVELTGTTTVSGNEFGGIEVSRGIGEKLPNSKLTVTGTLVNSTEAYGQPTIWLVNGQGEVAGVDALTQNTTIKADQTQYYIDAANAVEQTGQKILHFSANPVDSVKAFRFAVDPNAPGTNINDSIVLPSEGNSFTLYVTPASGKSLLSYVVTGMNGWGVGYAGERGRTDDEFGFSLYSITTDNPSVVFNYVNSPAVDKTTITATPGAAGSRTLNITIEAKDSDGNNINGITADSISITLKGDDGQEFWLPLNNYKHSPDTNTDGVKVSGFDTDETDNKLSFTLTFTTHDLTGTNKFSNLKDGGSVEFSVSVLRVVKSGLTGTIAPAPVVDPAIIVTNVPTKNIITETRALEDNSTGEITGFTTEGRTPIKVSLNKGSVDYKNVRVVVEGLNDGIQLIAKDTADKWYNIVKSGWGPTGGFALVDATTDVYLVANKEGTYSATIKLVDVSNNNEVLATATASVKAVAETNAATLDELKTALANTTIKTINITKDISDIPERLVVNRAVAINGANHKLTFTAALNGLEYGKRHGILIMADGVAINDLTVEMTGADGWQGVYGIQVYNAKGVVLNNYTGTKADGALLVNASEVELTGTTTVSGNEFGGIEVSKGIVEGLPNSKLTVTGTLVNNTEAYGQPTIWLVNEQGEVAGVEALTQNTTIKNDQTQYYIIAENATAPVITETNAATLDELKAALANTGIKTINITADIPAITETLVVDRAVAINGESHKLTFTDALNGLEDGKRQGILVMADGVAINDLTVEMTGAATWQGVYGIQVYNAKGVILNNYTGTKADGALLVNGSEVELTGTTTVSGNEFGGIEVSKGTAEGLPNSKLTVTGTLVNNTEAYGQPTIWLVNGQGEVTGENVPTAINKTIKNDQTQYYMIAENATIIS